MSRLKNGWLVFLIAITGGCIDQLTKWWARTYLPGAAMDLGLFEFRLVYNTGTAYGLFQNQTIILTMIGIVAILYLTLTAAFLQSKWDKCCYGLLLAGAVGNTLDRFFLNHVTDFINIRIIPIFNVADMCLTTAIAVMSWQFFRSLTTSSTSSTP